MKDPKKGNVYLLIGEESYLKEDFIQKTKNRFLDESNKELNFISFSAKDSGIEDILSSAKTAPFLSKKRVVVIKDVEKLEERKRDILLSFLKNPPESACLILESSKESGRQFMEDKFLTALSRHATLFKAEHPSYNALDAWVRQIAASSGKKITKEAVELLKELSGNDLGVLSKEVEKLISFIDKKDAISLEDVEKIIGKSVKEDVFILVDYIGSKDASKALLLCKNLLQHGKKAHEIIGLIGWYLRKLLLAKLALQTGKNQDVVLRELGLRRFYMNKLAGLLDNFKIDELKEKLKLLFVAERSIKTSSSKPEFILDVLISRLCAD
ncbi:MAG: DNA polymerase III subunit delta [Candidatus Omnitrophica bacterium CG07_land_8_20_14_0_80_42_15]|uniref:DNA polymerase III subunit delta n=1 Tax=Candidatus Aquitaenariimonas noxiae TaxID=1974741 RepID=A0A2J0KZH3_9BACT|nr:MAG: DNA polymerase III subunit delta [Candidatus Omnitrophica bacterium CG07_land_8_20_14_0_80_42_15]